MSVVTIWLVIDPAVPRVFENAQLKFNNSYAIVEFILGNGSKVTRFIPCSQVLMAEVS